MQKLFNHKGHKGFTSRKVRDSQSAVDYSFNSILQQNDIKIYSSFSF